jgi:Ca-activated chloride channel family protein
MVSFYKKRLKRGDLPMNSPVQMTQAWSKPYFPTGGEERAYLLLELKGDAGIRANRAPINISLVLDRSGSMSGSPLVYSKKACQFVTEQMGQEDSLSLVVFDDEVHTVIAPQSVTHKDIMKKHIAAIETGGSTNLSGGMLQGIQYNVQSRKENSVNRVILLSDGHANEGITDSTKLQAIVKEFRHAGIGLSTMGVGDGFDEELMEGIADAGGGTFYFIEKPEDIPGIFSKELDGLLSVTAQNIRLTIKPSFLTEITHIYGYKAEEGESGLTLNLGDIYGQETKSLLLELAFHPHKACKQEAVRLRWDYVDVTEGAKLCTYEYDIYAEFTNDLALLDLPGDAHVEKMVIITESAEAIEQALPLFDSGDIEGGKQLLQQQADHMLLASVKADDAQLREEAQILYSQLENFPYSPSTRKSLHEQKYRQMKRKN